MTKFNLKFRTTNDETNQAFGIIAKKINELETDLAEARSKNLRTEEEIRKEFEEEINSLEQELSLCPARFSEKEAEAYHSFWQKHFTMHGKSQGMMLHMTGTGIGTAYEVICPICNAKENITDYDCW